MIAALFIFSSGMYLIQNGVSATYIAFPLVIVYFGWLIYVIVNNKL